MLFVFLRIEVMVFWILGMFNIIDLILLSLILKLWIFIWWLMCLINFILLFGNRWVRLLVLYIWFDGINGLLMNFLFVNFGKFKYFCFMLFLVMYNLFWMFIGCNFCCELSMYMWLLFSGLFIGICIWLWV